MSSAISMPRARVAIRRCLKSARVPSAGRIAVWPPSLDPMAQGLPTSSGAAVTALFFPLRFSRPMGWMGGRYSTSKPIAAIASRRSSTSSNVPCLFGVGEQERGKSSYHVEKRARSRSTCTARSGPSARPSRGACSRATAKRASSVAAARSLSRSVSVRSVSVQASSRCAGEPGSRAIAAPPGMMSVAAFAAAGMTRGGADLGGQADVVGIDAADELIAPVGEVVDPALDGVFPAADGIDVE
jgi:hypothetical protein